MKRKRTVRKRSHYGVRGPIKYSPEYEAWASAARDPKSTRAKLDRLSEAHKAMIDRRFRHGRGR